MTGSTCGKVTGGVAGTVVAGLFVTATVYMGMYAMNNPDPDNCWVIRDLEMTTRTAAEAVATANAISIDVPEGYPVDMAKVFMAWFVWGFYAKIGISVLMLITAGIYFASENAAIITGAISCGLYLTNCIAWLVAGGIWRFSMAGITASGDLLERADGVTDEEWEAQRQSASVRQGYQLAGGRFIRLYIILAIWGTAIAIVGGIVGALVLACTGSKNAEGYESLEQKDDEAPATAEAPAEDGDRRQRRQRRERDREGRKQSQTRK